MLKITTNNAPRHVILGCELSPDELADFDYLSEEELACRHFVRYKGELYDMGDVMRVPEGGDLERQGWHGYADGSAWHCTVFKYTDDYESVICGLATW